MINSFQKLPSEYLNRDPVGQTNLQYGRLTKKDNIRKAPAIPNTTAEASVKKKAAKGS